MSIKKGTIFTSASGDTYTVTSFIISKQLVKYNLLKPGYGQEAQPDEMHLSEWKKLTVPVADLQAADLVNKAQEPINGKHDTTVEQAPKPEYKEGQEFEMMDKSKWVIEVLADDVLVIKNVKTAAQQDLTLVEFSELDKDGHIKFV